MSNRTLCLDDRLYDYLIRESVREPDLLAELRRETSALPMAKMQIGPEQGQFMALLIQIMGARNCLEVGTFTGYSALVCALALPEDGRLITLDVSEEWTQIATRFWARSDVGQRIDLRMGPAVESMRGLLNDGEADGFDFLFIDADKTGYADYYELGLKLVRPGGVIAFDNVLWGGSVADPSDEEADTLALRALNRKLHEDIRVDLSMVPIGDGLTLVWKRAAS
jgi:predicted O-methyltransferase YrrM